MVDFSKVSCFLYTDKHPHDIESTLKMFKGKSSSGGKMNLNVVKPHKKKNWDPDYSMVIDAFSKCDPDHHVIVCKDSAISNVPSTEILDIVESAITKCKFDLFYMAKWMDRCDQ